MDPRSHLAAISTEGSALAALPFDALERPVAACPGWTVARLIGHTGRVHRWAASFLAAGPDGGEPSAGPRPPEGAALLGWYRECLDELLDQLARQDPAAPVDSFAGPATAAFWFRRQAHEVAVHRWDAEDAARPGRAAPILAALAADGIDEWLELFVPRFLARRDQPVPDHLVGATVHVHCTDADLADGRGEWLLRLNADGSDLERAHAKGDAALRGAASDVLLALWHRLPLDRVDVVGDADRARAVLDLVHVT